MNITAPDDHKIMGMAAENDKEGHMMMMQMVFVLGNKVTLFFQNWKTTNNGELVGACIGLALIAFCYEGLKVLREIFKTRDSNFNKRHTQMWSRQHILQTALHTALVFVGYLLMLAFMTYNTWVCVAIIFGAGLGYFAFGWKINTIPSSGDHCN